MAKVAITDTCWLWTGYRGPTGYGAIGYSGKVIKAHRASYMVFRGEFETAARTARAGAVRRPRPIQRLDSVLRNDP